MRPIRIGAAQGFYGDTIEPAVATAKAGNVDYLCFDCLAELTMAILRKDQLKDENLGYTRDITGAMKALLPYVKEKGIKLLTNAGGLNPVGAQQEVLRVAQELGITDLKVAVVKGDNIFEDMEELMDSGISFDHWETNESISTIKDKLLFANAYIGAQPIVEALRQEADIVITGRTTDTAQFLAPLLYEFNWEQDDWNRLASGVFMGHLLECSAQSTGGNFSGDWQDIEAMDQIGYPIATCEPSGDFVVSKVEGSGGLVSPETIQEQMLYEIHDPSAYVTPDVVVDITKVQFEQVRDNEVKVTGVHGKPKPEELKVVMGYENGYMGQVIIGFSWPDALAKAKKADQIIRQKLKRHSLDYEELQTDFMGYNSLHGPLAEPPGEDINEIYLRMAIKTASKREAMKFARLFPPLALNGPPSMGAYIGNIPPRQLVGMWASLIPCEIVERNVDVHVQEVFVNA
ncbi:acyclic terpene utilization AtuA family protein [Pontibacillus yanchengensis]|uniref:Acyclic terpene utilization AtuA family protein n=2 Tax=Pontibacillus yanchengensis TaxID=462910 RepID=A0ACC7VDJ1_9BACI|nr:acyclic terpene utilization AtuA family protein [Pontibacillus yanchengensis]MYL52665.1 acyclic terpene utilization AtuA family protein [Pontibacillus yanchengensis]